MSSPHIFGKICHKHPELNGERYRSQKKCLLCIKESNINHKNKNREYILARDRGYHQLNRDKRILKSREYYRSNLERCRALAKQWAIENKERKSATSAAWSKKKLAQVPGVNKNTHRYSPKDNFWTENSQMLRKTDCRNIQEVS